MTMTPPLTTPDPTPAPATPAPATPAPTLPGKTTPPAEPVPGTSVMTGSTVIAWLVGLTAVVAAAAMLRFEAPRTVLLPWSDVALPESCGAQRMLGIDCPGCGLTRSFILTAHGRLGDAFQMHPAGTLAFIVLTLIIPLRLWQGYRVAIGRPPRSTVMAEVWVLLSLLVLSFVWWGIKLVSQPPWLS
ncbi:DUF2752 domain-containing protein [Roseimaritima ulvae]|uniref:DUF2752 domain-containing protein n=1 Tax=Roseimaritima ulvae TaxID=980254 RepID=A0A5B9R164_9BACT|nr:DUF2752 domain-containing protein [Roseimaritima ulvae]QEG40053.1 hypothetical protein UC8_20570 [Roseimaritima ulvae]